MNWLRENPFLAGLAALTILGGSALIFLMMQAMGRFQETADAYAQAVQRLHALQNRSPFPNVANLEKSQAQKAQYAAELDALRKQLARMQTPTPPDISPQKFQDDLRTAVNFLTEKAAAAGVELPKGFYLGFGQYANSLPNERAAPALERQLGVINKIVTDLIEFRVRSIDSLDRLPLPEESSAPPPASPPTESNTQRGKQPEASPIGLARHPLDLAFTAEQGKLRVAFNSLINADQFLIVRNLTFENTARVGPPISREVPASTALAHRAPGTSTQGLTATNNLNVILGRELVKASLRLEMIDFPAEGQPAK